jgi:hypothetical protein
MNGVSVLTMLKGRWPWLIGCFFVVTVASWMALGVLSSPTYLSTGLVELGYFNPRDYQPHPVMSTRAVAALVNDPSFAGHVATILDQHPQQIGGAFQLNSAPIEEGLLRVEARAADGRRSQEAAAIACSLVVGITVEDYQRERALMNSQLELVKNRSALAESLIFEGPTASQRGSLQGDALRALALFTEIQVEKESEAELISQKKRSVVVVNPGPGTEERPPALVISMGPALVVTILLAAAFLGRESGGGEPQV